MLKAIATTFLLLSSFGSPAASPPDSPVLQVFKQWLDAFNSGDAARITAFWQQYQGSGAESRTKGDLQLRQMTGGMKIFKVTEDNGIHLVALMQEARGRYSESTLDLASTNPLRVGRIGGHPVPPPGESGRAANDEDLARHIRTHVAHLPSGEAFSGAILVAHNGKIVLDQASGMANTEKQIRNTTDTQFCLGSMNKMFTAVAILQLVQQRKIALDEPIGKYWSDYPNHDLAHRVTVRQLLDHTGGTGDIFTPEYEAHRQETRTLADYVKLFGDRPVRFEPGSRMEYSNYGFILLGRLIELISGESYESYVLKRVFFPAGMFHTDSRPEADRVEGRAKGYTHGPGGLVPNMATLPWRGTSAGGGYSTVHDLLRFAGALQSGKLLSPALLDEATKDQTQRGYGLGFYVLRDGGYGHGGGAPGINGELHILPENGYVIIALANRDPMMATNLVGIIQSMLPRQ